MTNLLCRVLQVLILLLSCLGLVHGFTAITPGSKLTPKRHDPTPRSEPPKSDNSTATTYSFSVPLTNKRPKPDSFLATFIELWNDPRPVSSLIASKDRSSVGARENRGTGTVEEIPYCIVSDELSVEGEVFQILLYPRGRFVRDEAGAIAGPAAAYLRYLPRKYGDEIDIAWKLRLCTGTDRTPLSIGTSGGLPRSNTTWSAMMTFCAETEAVESVGRTTDWGSSGWSAREVCDALGSLVAEGDITVFDRRRGGSSFSWPLLGKGAAGAVYKAATAAPGAEGRVLQREYRAGEVIVPRNIQGLEADMQALKQTFVYPGIDYRIMTMADKDGKAIFSTEDVEGEDDKRRARLALRPCGWKTQQQLWARNGMETEWPVEVNAGLLFRVTTTRFNRDSAVPRIVSAFQRDWITYSLALALALTPIPLTLFARNFVSLYDIPSASMEPTLMKGDVLLVEKFPGVYRRTQRGDVVLFKPPSALREIVLNSGSQLSSTSLFVKRLAGVPGDESLRLTDDGTVLIDGKNAVGPDRNQCADEPLRLIDKLLENGKGKEVERLGDDDTYVLGDCKAVSVDSRVFGILPKENIVGKPLARIWPLNRIKLSGPF